MGKAGGGAGSLRSPPAFCPPVTGVQGLSGGAPVERSYHCSLKKKKKSALPDSYAETKGTVVSFFQEAKELVENILVSLGVARFQCASEKGARGKEVEHI